MKIGVIKEIKDKENRIALTPAGAERLIAEGHAILIEKDAGLGSGFSNEEYQSLGASLVTTEEAWGADLVIKVKEPLEQAYQYFKDNILFTYLHLAGVSERLTGPYSMRRQRPLPMKRLKMIGDSFRYSHP